MTLPNELLKSSNTVHFSRANASLRAKFSPVQQRDILAGNRQEIIHGIIIKTEVEWS